MPEGIVGSGTNGGSVGTTTNGGSVGSGVGANILRGIAVAVGAGVGVGVGSGVAVAVGVGVAVGGGVGVAVGVAVGSVAQATSSSTSRTEASRVIREPPCRNGIDACQQRFRPRSGRQGGAGRALSLIGITVGYLTIRGHARERQEGIVQLRAQPAHRRTNARCGEAGVRRPVLGVMSAGALLRARGHLRHEDIAWVVWLLCNLSMLAVAEGATRMSRVSVGRFLCTDRAGVQVAAAR